MNKRKNRHKRQKQRQSSFKKCRNCNQKFIMHNFVPDKRTKDGYSKVCILCKEKFSYGYSTSLKIPLRSKFQSFHRKICSKCGEIKTYSKFRLRDKERQQFYGQCKKCQHKREAEYRGNLSPEQKAKNIEYQKNYRETEHGRSIIRKGNKRYYQKNKERVNARTATHYAVMRGQLPHISTLICSKCGDKATDYHHHKGYKREFWIDVIPICKKCHHIIKERKA